MAGPSTFNPNERLDAASMQEIVDIKKEIQFFKDQNLPLGEETMKAMIMACARDDIKAMHPEKLDKLIDIALAQPDNAAVQAKLEQAMDPRKMKFADTFGNTAQAPAMEAAAPPPPPPPPPPKDAASQFHQDLKGVNNYVLANSEQDMHKSKLRLMIPDKVHLQNMDKIEALMDRAVDHQDKKAMKELMQFMNPEKLKNFAVEAAEVRGMDTNATAMASSKFLSGTAPPEQSGVFAKPGVSAPAAPSGPPPAPSSRKAPAMGG